MQFLDLTLPMLEANLALDEALLLEAEMGAGGEVLRLWEWPTPAVVLGSGCRLAEDVNEAACQADGVPIARRASGGGTVLLGAGCLLYSVVLAYERDPALREIGSSYVYILEKVREAVTDILPAIACAGTSDLASAGRKFSGNAQQRKRNYVLHHASLLYGLDLEMVGRYLHVPPRQPEYRRGRDHTEFVHNLPVSADELKYRLRAAWGTEAKRLAWPENLVGDLLADKYSKTEWLRRR